MTTFDEQGCSELVIPANGIGQVDRLLSEWAGMAIAWKFDSNDHRGSALALASCTFKEEWNDTTQMYEITLLAEQRTKVEVRMG